MSDSPGPHEPLSETFSLSAFHYELPSELIAQEPAATRDQSRLLVVDKNRGIISHHFFCDLPNFLKDSDILVLNETHVVPALLIGRKSSGGSVELLVLDPVPQEGTSSESQIVVRECLIKSSKPLKSGTKIIMNDGAELVTERPVSPGRARVVFPSQEKAFMAFLSRYGSMPLPPYIKRTNRREQRDRERYQTVYAKTSGSVAAPTAGLHFSHQLLRNLQDRGVTLAHVVLHVGPGTFIPVREKDIRHHKMEREHFFIPPETADLIGKAISEDRRIVAVGTTTVRALESAADENNIVKTGYGSTNLFIFPGYHFKIVQGLITNFHLPGSTLLMLVCAFGSYDLVMRAYGEALAAGYQWYSYGDASLII